MTRDFDDDDGLHCLRCMCFVLVDVDIPRMQLGSYSLGQHRHNVQKSEVCCNSPSTHFHANPRVNAKIPRIPGGLPLHQRRSGLVNLVIGDASLGPCLAAPVSLGQPPEKILGRHCTRVPTPMHRRPHCYLRLSPRDVWPRAVSIHAEISLRYKRMQPDPRPAFRADTAQYPLHHGAVESPTVPGTALSQQHPA